MRNNVASVCPVQRRGLLQTSSRTSNNRVLPHSFTGEETSRYGATSLASVVQV